MIDIVHITKTYRKGKAHFIALDNVTFSVRKGDFILIDGPSGAGKSTLLYTIGGLIKPDTGQVFFENMNIYEKSGAWLNEYRKNKVGFMFQQFHLMPYLTLKENIMLSCNKNVSASAVNDYIDKCFLISLANKYPSELSVGEKQRTAFIRAIISEPVMLLGDEPTGNLDPGNSNALMSLVQEYHQKGGTVIIVSHDPSIIPFANVRITLEKGKIMND
jgi:putative ABC transport system ATP-binding protein